MTEQLLELLYNLKVEHNADCVKVYYEKADNYCIKIIKDERIIKVFRKKSGNKGFYLRK